MTAVASGPKYSFVNVNPTRVCLACGHLVPIKGQCRFCGAGMATFPATVVCPTCRCEARSGAQSCSNCGEALGHPCDGCGASMDPHWRLCPICGTLKVEIKGSRVEPARTGKGRWLARALLLLALLGSWAVAGWLWWERDGNRQVWVGQDPESVPAAIQLPRK